MVDDGPDYMLGSLCLRALNVCVTCEVCVPLVIVQKKTRMDQREREGSREAGSNVEYFAITKHPSKHRLVVRPMFWEIFCI